MNEDFVTFELAKKLKEKGFDMACIYAYCEKGGWNSYTQKHEPITYILRTDGNPFGSYYTGKNWNKEYKTNKNKIQCSAPTISQVLKWLRDEKKIHIMMATYSHYPNNTHNWGYEIINLQTYTCEHYNCRFNSYEDAALAGIEYVIDNFI